ncbi:kinesin-like protein KIN-14F [Zingiber officinale]|uniref:kinesin-like protein KIN-14F n=1 Tax=Zingiber officinale TaxID=94328 RepID=UPI001C4C7055|nr:kinesin-like protein KIN-14F [Zingiber officinale]
MALEGSISVPVVEDALKQHGARMCYIDLASRKEEQAAMRRYEAAAWLRRMVGVVGAKDLPEEPTEEEFRLALRNGIVLCNVLNKVKPGAVPKVIEAPVVSASQPDGAAVLSAFQYFENLRNFLDALEELGLPTFEASDLEQGGKGSRVVNSILALKSFDEKQVCRSGSSKSGGTMKPSSTGKHFVRRNSEPFMNSIIRSQTIQDGGSLEQNLSIDFSIESSEMMTSPSVSMLVRNLLSDKKAEEVPLIVESMLTKVLQEFEHRLARQQEMMDKNETIETSLFNGASNSKEFQSTCCENKMKVIDEMGSLYEASNSTEIQSTACENKVKVIDKIGSLYDASNSPQVQNTWSENKMLESESTYTCLRGEDFTMSLRDQEKTKEKLLKQGLLVEKQKREIHELKNSLLSTRESVELIKTQYSEEVSKLGKHMQIITHAASGYQKVLEENRKLYNQVQDLKGNIRVYCRVRPFLPGKSSNNLTTVDHIDDGNITISTPAKYGKEGHKSFSFNKTFGPSVTQEEVFSDTKPLIRSILDGFNVCIFAYGQTGSGKTYTMSGPKELTEEGYGVNYRALNDLFQISRQRRDSFCYEIAVQMMEIYNEQVRDLLNDGPNKKLDIRNSSQSGMAVPDANLVPVTSTDEVVELMNLGQRNRAVCSTSMNERSSRSHSCLTIHVHGKELASGTVLRGCLHLVDLAGSERVNKSEVKGDRLKEAQHINKSLAALGDVIYALAQKNSHVPYRNSKLTQLLQDSLGGQAKTLMFVHISPEVDALSETLSTLKFAERVATIELGAAKMNKDTGELKELRQQVASLRAALAKKEEETLGSTTSSSDSYRMKSNPTSPGHPNQMQTMDDFGNIVSCSALMEREDIDAVNDEDPLRAWVGDSVHLPDSLDQGYIPDVRVFRDRRTSRPNSFTTDDYDDLDFATSDSSEQEVMLQSSNAKSSAAVNGGSRIKQLQSGSTKNPDLRNPTRSHMPSPSRKTSTATSSQTAKGQPTRQRASDGKRKPNVNGRMAASK